MKRIFLSVCMSLLLITAFCQKPSLTKAYNLYYERNFTKAKAAIDLCTTDEKLSAKASTWLYKANIYYYLANEEYGKRQNDESYKIAEPTTPEEAYDAFVKAKSINKNAMATDMLAPDEGLPKMYTLLLIQGVDLLMDSKYDAGKRVLEKAIKSYEMQKPEYPLNGEIYYYYAYALEMLNRPKDAIAAYEKAITDNSKDANVFLRLIENYKKDNLKDKVLETIEKGKQTLPDNIDIKVAEVDYYYWVKDNRKGKELLQKLPAAALNTPTAIVNVANIYIADSNYTEAETMLQRAYRSYEPNFAVIYNLGVCCYYISQNKFAAANQYDVQGNKELAAAVKKESDDYLDKAENYFEKALEIEPSEESVLNILKNIYARKQSPKYDEIIKRIGN